MLFCTEYGCRWQITVCLYKKNYVHNMRMNCEKKDFQHMKNYYQLNQVIKLRHWRMSFFFILVEYSKTNGQYNDRF